MNRTSLYALALVGLLACGDDSDAGTAGGGGEGTTGGTTSSASTTGASTTTSVATSGTGGAGVGGGPATGSGGGGGSSDGGGDAGGAGGGSAGGGGDAGGSGGGGGGDLAQLTYRITNLQFASPAAAEHTKFAELMNTLLQFAFVAPDPLYLLAGFDSVGPGPATVVVTFCQGAGAAGTSCISDPPPVQTVGSLDADGTLTTNPVDFAFSLDVQGQTVLIPLNGFTIDGLLDPLASNGGGAPPGALTGGTFSAELPAAGLCEGTLSNGLLGPLCDDETTVNLLELIDGPAFGCGQDASADADLCTGSTDTVDHNPSIDGAFAADGGLDLEGFDFTP